VAVTIGDECPARSRNVPWRCRGDGNIRQDLEIEVEPCAGVVGELAHRPVVARDEHPQGSDAGLFRPSPGGYEQVRANPLPAPVCGYRERRLGDPVAAWLEHLNHADEPALGEDPGYKGCGGDGAFRIRLHAGITRWVAKAVNA
jgi:hypothetical protein